MWGRWRRRAKRGEEGERIAAEPRPSGDATPVQRTFAEYFAAWGLFLPDEAIASRSAGYLLGKGWSVRWRWVDGDGDDATLEFLASHRMTNERWQRIAPDGALSKIDVPFEAMVFPPDAGDEQRAAIEHDYRAAWGTHIAAVEQAGMDPIQGRPRIPNEVAGPALMTWMIDGGDWQSAPLLARS